MIFRDSDIKALERRQVRAVACVPHSCGLPQKVFSFLLPIMFVFPALAQETAESSGEPATKLVIKQPPPVYKSDKRKDPFLHFAPPSLNNPPLSLIKVVEEDEEVPRGTPPPGIAGTLIGDAGVEGIVTQRKRRFAVVRGKDNRAYFLYEGDRLFDGYLKTIEKDSVVFVRETFMRSGKTLTLEITKRLRKS